MHWFVGVPLWLIAILTAILPVLCVRQRMRSKQNNSGVYAACGYDLRRHARSMSGMRRRAPESRDFKAEGTGRDESRPAFMAKTFPLRPLVSEKAQYLRFWKK